MYDAMLGVRSISGSMVPVYVWQPASAAGIMYRFGPERYGGNGDLSEKVKKIHMDVGDDEEARYEEEEKVRLRDRVHCVFLDCGWC